MHRPINLDDYSKLGNTKIDLPLKLEERPAMRHEHVLLKFLQED
jgi:hypothetical protein